MSSPTFPEKGSSAFGSITSAFQYTDNYVHFVQSVPTHSLKCRAELLRSLIKNRRIKETWKVDEWKQAPEFTIQDAKSDAVPDWLDGSSDEDILMDAKECPPSPQSPAIVPPPENRVDVSELHATRNVMPIEEIGEEAQNELLDLKSALHQGLASVDVSLLFNIGCSERLKAIAHDLSKLPTPHVATVLKAFLNHPGSSGMLQQDLIIIGVYLVLCHLTMPTVMPGVLLVSVLAEFATKWLDVFGETVVRQSIKHFDADLLVKTLKKTFKLLGQRESAECVNTLLKSTVKFVSKPSVDEETKLKAVNTSITLTEVLVRNTPSLDHEVVGSLGSVYSMFQHPLSSSKAFAKLTLECVKKTGDLGHSKAALDSMVNTMMHPLRSIIKKVAANK